VPDSAVPKYFSAADVVVLTLSQKRRSGVASLAMAFGKPIIISELENIKESLGEYQGTKLVPCGDATSIADKISEVYAQYKAGKVLTMLCPFFVVGITLTTCFRTVIDQIN